MKENAKKQRSFKENVAMILRGYKIVFQVYPRYIVWEMINCIFGTVTPYFSLYMTALIINELVSERDVEKLFLLAGITVLGVFIISIVKRMIQGKVNVYGSDTWRLDQLYYLQVQNRMQYEHLEDPDVSLLREDIYTSKTATGGGIQILLWNIRIFVSAVINMILSVSLTVSLFYLTAEGNYTGFFAFINSPLAMLIVLVLIIGNAIVNIITVNRETRKVDEEWQELSASNRMHGALNIWGLDTYIFGMKKLILRENKKLNNPRYIERSQKHKMKYGTIRTIWNHMMTAVLFIFVAAKAYIGVFALGNFVLYRGTVSKFISGVSDIASVIGRIVQNNDPLSKLFEFLDLPDDMYHGELTAEKRSDNQYEIEFRDVSFKYPRSDTWALRHVSTKIKIDSRMAIVGMNGSGKTTFIKLLCRLYDPTEGQILLNGIDIKKYRYKDYISLFSAVFQDYKLFSFSIAENVAGTLDYDKDKVLDCIHRVGLDEKIGSLKNGIETSLHRDYANDGVDFSGGEAQKLAIARALYKGSSFVILDEPTAALDPRAEAEIYNQFDSIVENKTAIYISHRLSSCRFCDNILVFDKGNIVQCGVHDDLVADQNGKYYELWHAQAQYYTDHP